MTNKTERYYVVSEDQLVVLGIENRNYGFNVSVDQVNDWLARLKKAEAACRAREVHLKSIFRNGIGEQVITWEELRTAARQIGEA